MYVSESCIMYHGVYVMYGWGRRMNLWGDLETYGFVYGEMSNGQDESQA